jgi:hypothetical protein
MEIMDEFYVDEYNDEVKKYIYDWVRKHFIDVTFDDKELEEYCSLQLDIGRAIYLCDVCGRETEKFYFVNLSENQKDYDLCQDCYQSVANYLEKTKRESLKWKTNILGSK